MDQWYRNKISHVFLWNQSILSFVNGFFLFVGCDCTKRNSTGSLKSDSECNISQMHVVSKNFFPPLYARPKQSWSWTTGRKSFRFWNSSITRSLFSGVFEQRPLQPLRKKYIALSLISHTVTWKTFCIALWKKKKKWRRRTASPLYSNILYPLSSAKWDLYWCSDICYTVMCLTAWWKGKFRFGHMMADELKWH